LALSFINSVEKGIEKILESLQAWPIVVKIWFEKKEKENNKPVLTLLLDPTEMVKSLKKK
jgi:Trp operon repressor